MDRHVTSDFQTFKSMKKEWNELAAEFASPFLRHEWFETCLDALYPKGVQPTIFTIRSGGRLRAAAPLISIRRSGLRQLQVPGADIIHEPCGFIYDSEAALTELFHAILQKQTSLTLSRFNVRAQETLTLRERCSKGGVRIDRCGASSLRVPLKRTWKEFEASMSSGRRSDLRTYRRRAEQLGKVEFAIVHPEASTLDAHLEELFRIEASGWKGQEGSAILCQPHIRRFYTNYAQSATAAGMLRLFFLNIGGKSVAARMAVEHNKRLWDLRMGYDETFSRCAPGVLLTHETLRYAVDCGLEAYEFLGRAEAWERHWPCQEEHYASMRVYPFSLQGQLALVQDGCQLVTREASRAAQNYVSRATTTARRLGAIQLPSVLSAARTKATR
jgi:CelD/BcsL family acetyltransferase involved in cellulose biosynthesis